MSSPAKRTKHVFSKVHENSIALVAADDKGDLVQAGVSLDLDSQKYQQAWSCEKPEDYKPCAATVDIVSPNDDTVPFAITVQGDPSVALALTATMGGASRFVGLVPARSKRTFRGFSGGRGNFVFARNAKTLYDTESKEDNPSLSAVKFNLTPVQYDQPKQQGGWGCAGGWGSSGAGWGSSASSAAMADTAVMGISGNNVNAKVKVDNGKIIKGAMRLKLELTVRVVTQVARRIDEKSLNETIEDINKTPFGDLGDLVGDD